MIVRHTLLYTVVKLLPALASVITLMAFTRLMSPAQFGEYSLTVTASTTLVAILANFLVIGLGRFEPAICSNEERLALHSTVLATALILSFFVGVVILLLGMFNILPNLSIDYFFLALLFTVSVLLMLSQKLINANLLPKKYGFSLALKNTLLLILGVSGLLLGLGVHIVLASLALASLVASLPAVSLWAKSSFKSFDLNVLRKIWTYGAPLTLLYLFVMIINFSDRIFIDVMLGSSAVGLYSAGYDLTQYTIGIVASIIHLAAFPIILKAHEKDGAEKTRALLDTSYKILLLVMVPVTLGFIAVQNELSVIFLGSAFTSTATTIMPILALSVLLSSIKSYYFDYSFQLTKTTWLQAIPPLIAASINLILNYSFIIEFGLIGAAYASLVAFLIYLIATAYLSGKVFDLPSFQWFFSAKILFSSFIMMEFVKSFIFDYSMVVNLIIKVFLGVFIYLLLLALSNPKYSQGLFYRFCGRKL